MNPPDFVLGRVLSQGYTSTLDLRVSNSGDPMQSPETTTTAKALITDSSYCSLSSFLVVGAARIPVGGAPLVVIVVVVVPAY